MLIKLLMISLWRTTEWIEWCLATWRIVTKRIERAGIIVLLTWCSSLKKIREHIVLWIRFFCLLCSCL